MTQIIAMFENWAVQPRRIYAFSTFPINANTREVGEPVVVSSSSQFISFPPLLPMESRRYSMLYTVVWKLSTEFAIQFGLEIDIRTRMRVTYF